jgi:ABC-type phosphate/phosphonate transport system substrate-binding protein
MTIRKKIINWTLIGLSLMLGCHSVQARELIMSAAPRESKEEGKKLYQPVANHFSKLLGVKVTYKHAGNWLRYQSNIKKMKYDIVLDGPHLASWRIEYTGHQPLMKLPVSLQFYIVAKADNTDINKPEDLVFKQVCAIPPPNLTSIILLNRLNDPVREPVIHSVSGGMKQIYKDLMKEKCAGGVLRTDFYDKKLTNKQKSSLKIVYTSPLLPGQVITVSDQVSKEQRLALLKSFTTGEGVSIMEPVVKRFAGKNAKTFIPVVENEYAEYYKYVHGVVLGW